MWEVAIFVLTDLVQIQHVSIALLLFAVGMLDIYTGLWKVQSIAWQLLWLANSALVGIVFIIHPEHDFQQTFVHQFLGLALFFGAFFMFFSRIHNWWYDNMWIHSLSSLCYASSIMFLLTVYTESKDSVYKGIHWTCNGSSVLTISAGLFAGCSIIVTTYCIIHAYMTGRAEDDFEDDEADEVPRVMVDSEGNLVPVNRKKPPGLTDPARNAAPEPPKRGTLSINYGWVKLPKSWTYDPQAAEEGKGIEMQRPSWRRRDEKKEHKRRRQENDWEFPGDENDANVLHF